MLNNIDEDKTLNFLLETTTGNSLLTLMIAHRLSLYSVSDRIKRKLAKDKAFIAESISLIKVVGIVKEIEDEKTTD